MSDDIFTVSAPNTAEYEIKKSLFIGAIAPCQTEQEAIQFLNHLASQHSNANHLAFAWRLRQPDGFISERCNDGGEPSGTAGRPILAPLEGGKIINAAVGVIRYFGGVKLGTGGLARAYGNAAKMAIDTADLSEWIEMSLFTLTIEYSQLQLLEYHLAKYDGKLLDQVFTDKVTVTVQIAKTHQQTIKSLFDEYSD